MRHKNSDTLSAIEKYITEYAESCGNSPTLDEIAAGLNISKATASRYLAFMRTQGIVDYSGHRNITTKALQKNRQETTCVPVLGNVSCGLPKFAEENIEEYVRLPVSLFGQGEFFILRANGDSMVEAGIDNGDLVLIRRQNTADAGQIVVALTDDEATLKRYYPEPEKHRVRLHPENSSMADIFVDSCVIQGIAVKVFKDLA